MSLRVFVDPICHFSVDQSACVVCPCRLERGISPRARRRRGNGLLLDRTLPSREDSSFFWTATPSADELGGEGEVGGVEAERMRA